MCAGDGDSRDLSLQVAPIVLSVMDGYPSMIMAYGEVASGQRELSQHQSHQYLQL